MNYPLISEYVEAIKSAEDNFNELVYLRPVLGDDGLPVMTSGNFAVVFKMKDENSGKYYAVKCFTKEHEGRAEAYCEITKELQNVKSQYLVSLRYIEKELFVDTDQTEEEEFPVLLMDWVEGKTLDKYLRENLDDKYALEMLAYRFSQLAQWLISQPFAHGDLKPDNIIVREDGSLVLVDYDGMYVPAMKGQKARELGSPDFRHPQRTEKDFDEHIDDFPLVSILLSLKAISINPQLLAKYGAEGKLLFSESDYRNFDVCPLFVQDFPQKDIRYNSLTILLYQLLSYPSQICLQDIFSFRLNDLIPFNDSDIFTLAIWYTMQIAESVDSFGGYVRTMLDMFGTTVLFYLKSMFSLVLYPVGKDPHEKFEQLYKERDSFDLFKYNVDVQIDPFYYKRGYDHQKALEEASNLYWHLFADALKAQNKAKVDAQYELASLWKSGYLLIPNISNTTSTRIELWEIDINYNLERSAYGNYWISILREAAFYGHIGAQLELSSFYRYGVIGVRDIHKADEWEKIALYNLYLAYHKRSVYSNNSYSLEFGCMNVEQIER